jgi:hypothetical protein
MEEGRGKREAKTVARCKVQGEIKEGDGRGKAREKKTRNSKRESRN